jgi:hypothetical protein
MGDPQMIGYIESDSIRTLLGQRIVPVGDQNADGYDDFLASELGRGVWLYLGGSQVNQTALLRFNGLRLSNYKPMDLNGDGVLDFLLRRFYQADIVERVELYSGGSSLSTIPDKTFGSTGYSPFNIVAFSEDVTGDGKDEIVTQELSQNRVLIFELGSDSDSLADMIINPIDTSAELFGESIASADFNGDGMTDIALSVRYLNSSGKPGELHIYFGGSLFDTIPDVVLRRPNPDNPETNTFWALGRLISPSDVNGDGFNDLVETSRGNSDDSMAYVYFGGPSIDSIADLVVPRRNTGGGSGGDLNGDTFADFVTYFSTSLNDVGYLSIYLGGPNLDGEYDFSLSPASIPMLQTEFGIGATGIGDYNNDGINDFAFSAVESNSHARIYIYSGFSPATDVNEDLDVPRTHMLSQNYPNPFNPSTTISYSVPSSSHVTLQIFNSIGEIVRTLVDQRISAGEHTTQWDGTTYTGSRVASGTYFYQLSIDGVRSAKKMVLLK